MPRLQGPSHHKWHPHLLYFCSGGDVEADLAAERYSVTTWMDILRFPAKARPDETWPALELEAKSIAWELAPSAR